MGVDREGGYFGRRCKMLQIETGEIKFDVDALRFGQTVGKVEQQWRKCIWQVAGKAAERSINSSTATATRSPLNCNLRHNLNHDQRCRTL